MKIIPLPGSFITNGFMPLTLGISSSISARAGADCAIALPLERGNECLSIGPFRLFKPSPASIAFNIISAKKYTWEQLTLLRETLNLGPIPDNIRSRGICLGLDFKEALQSYFERTQDPEIFPCFFIMAPVFLLYEIVDYLIKFSKREDANPEKLLECLKSFKTLNLWNEESTLSNLAESIRANCALHERSMDSKTVVVRTPTAFEDISCLRKSAFEGNGEAYGQLIAIGTHPEAIDFLETNYRGSWHYFQIAFAPDIPAQVARAAAAMDALFSLAECGHERAFGAIEGVVIKGGSLPRSTYQLPHLTDNLSKSCDMGNHHKFPVWLRAIAMTRRFAVHSGDFSNLLRALYSSEQYTLNVRIRREIMQTMDASRLSDDGLVDAANNGHVEAGAKLAAMDMTPLESEIASLWESIAAELDIKSSEESRPKFYQAGAAALEGDVEAKAITVRINQLNNLITKVRSFARYNISAMTLLLAYASKFHMAREFIEELYTSDSAAGEMIERLFKERPADLILRRLSTSLKRSEPSPLTVREMFTIIEEEDTALKRKRAAIETGSPIDWNSLCSGPNSLVPAWSVRGLQKMYDLLIKQGLPLTELRSTQHTWVFSETDRQLLAASLLSNLA